MTTLTVGSGQQYTTIAAAVAASKSGDTISVNAGTYTNDFLTISHNLTIQAAGNGAVNLVATVQPPNGKAIIDEGGSGVSVTLSGLTLSGAAVADGNGAGVRYEGGTLVMKNMTVTGNQEGLLGAADSNGSITIDHSTFTANGAGDGRTHNIYVGAINSLTVTNSTISDAIVGHDIKSRAANNTITNNVITDTKGTASYEIDLPNGGNAVISGNVIEKGANAQNPIAISYGEEGSTYSSNSLSVTGNTMLNDFTAHSTTALVNTLGVTATLSGNTLYGWNSLSSGAVSVLNNTLASVEPTLSALTSALLSGITGSTGTGTTTTGTTTTGSTTTGSTTGTASTGSSSTSGSSTTVTPTTTTSSGSTSTGTTTTTTPAVTPTTTTTTPAATPTTTTTTPAATTTTPATPVKPADTTLGSGPDKIVLKVSEDAWQGDAQFLVSVDGKQFGGTLTATASHAAGQSQNTNLLGNFGTGQHTVAVYFLNDAYGGTAATDRNLYVDGLVDGATITKGATLASSGIKSFIVGTPAVTTVGSGPNKIALQISEDAWQGDAQFTVKVDGKQVGGTLTAGASHALGQVQEFDIQGSFAPGKHQVAISFLNDAYGGTSATDRNLWVNQVGGSTVNTPLYANGTQTFTTILPSS